MSENEAGQSSEEESLKQIFEEALKLYEKIENGKEPTNTDSVQMTVRSAISKLEKATNLVSWSGMFSSNESIEELNTETLQYLLLPVMLGVLTLKLVSKNRRELIDVAEIYFRDFLQRCKDYGITDVEIPPPSSEQKNESNAKPMTEKDKIFKMVKTRDEKIKRYSEMKDLKEKLASLKEAMDSPFVDDETKREYSLTLLEMFIQQALDELDSLEQEKPILEYMAKHSVEAKENMKKDREHRTPLKPVIITKDAVQKAVFGLGYPSIPAMTIEEFYDKRVREGTFPGPGTNIPHSTIQNTEQDADEGEQVRKERLIEDDDPEELERQRNMDEYKDDHRRGWGNRYNRS